MFESPRECDRGEMPRSRFALRRTEPPQRGPHPRRWGMQHGRHSVLVVGVNDFGIGAGM